MLLVVLGGLWLLCLIWARSLARGITLTREMRFGWTQVGDTLEERYRLINDSNFPALWVEVRDLSSMPGYDTSRGTGVGGKSQTEWRTQGVCSRRGVFTLGPTRIITGDPFGIYTVTLDMPPTQSLLVLPPIIPLPAIEVAPGGRAGEGRPRPFALERTVSAATVRDYVPGDSLHLIHWRSTAHRDHLSVRLFESTPASDWWIVLDMERSVHAGVGEQSTEEHAITSAASLADRGLRDGKSVGLLAYGEELVWLPPRADEMQRWNILRAMALLHTGTLPLADVLQRSRTTLGKHASLIVITPRVQQRWIEELMLLMRGGAVPTVLLLDAAAYGAQPGPTTSQAQVASLSALGITCSLLTPDTFNRPEARPGHLGQWEMQTLPTGRVVVAGTNQNTGWRGLT
jgi:uncharacterized protein (DUF58 family)